MNGTLEVLVASSQLENRRALIHVLEALSANVISSSSIQQAAEVLREVEKLVARTTVQECRNANVLENRDA